MGYDEIYETLAALYLRLGGYFTTGLIIHSESKGNNRGEVDWLAIRMPFHNQDARAVKTPDFLGEFDGHTDLLICEVKSSRIGFNESLRSCDNLGDVLRWAGVIPEDKIAGVAARLLPLLHDDASPQAVREGVTESTVRVSPLLCYPSVPADQNDGWRLTEEEIFGFIDSCLDPKKAPATCARRYPYEMWGSSFEHIVRWFKGRKKEEPLTAAELVRHLLAQRSQRR